MTKEGDFEIAAWLAAEGLESQTPDQTLRHLDDLISRTDLHPAYQAALERMAIRLATETGDLGGALNRYRRLAADGVAPPDVLALLIAAIGDKALAADDAVRFPAARSELTRILAHARAERSDSWAQDPVWTGLSRLIEAWDTPLVTRAVRSFERDVELLLGHGSDQRADMVDPVSGLVLLSQQARTGVDDAAVHRAIEGRRAFWTIKVLAADQGDALRAWRAYGESAGVMTPADRVETLIAIALLLPAGEPVALIAPVRRELDAAPTFWPGALSAHEAETRVSLLAQAARISSRLAQV